MNFNASNECNPVLVAPRPVRLATASFSNFLVRPASRVEEINKLSSTTSSDSRELSSSPSLRSSPRYVPSRHPSITISGQNSYPADLPYQLRPWKSSSLSLGLLSAYSPHTRPCYGLPPHLRSKLSLRPATATQLRIRGRRQCRWG